MKLRSRGKKASPQPGATGNFRYREESEHKRRIQIKPEVFCETAWLLFSAAVSSSSAATEYYVFPDGVDDNPGTEARLFLTLTRVRDAVREVSEAMTADVHVYWRDGKYRLSQTYRPRFHFTQSRNLTGV